MRPDLNNASKDTRNTTATLLQRWKSWRIEIPADLQPFVREQLELGCFPSEQQLVTEALQFLKADREELLENIKRVLEEAAAPRVQPLAEAFADIRRGP